MNKTIFPLLFSLIIALPVHAAEDAPTASNLRANFKRVALELSSTSVSNAKDYQNSPNSKLSSDSESVVKGVFDFVLEYEQPNYQWNNSLFMEYGKTHLKPADGENSSNENADKILLTSDYSRKMWRYADADIGPFASLAYQTEFTANTDAPRAKILRGMGGLKLFNGVYVKELYAALVEEYDMTYAKTNTKTGYEIGVKAEYPLREGVKFQLESYFRNLLYFSSYQGTDFKYEFNVTTRMDVKITDTFSLAPYLTYFQAQDRESNKYGSNLMIGVSLAYADLFNL